MLVPIQVLAGLKAPPERPSDGLDESERAVFERSHYLLRTGWASWLGPGVAGIVGHRLAQELQAAARFSVLMPNAWRYQLEVEQPGYVLVTSDALDPSEAWGGYGVAEGCDGADELAAVARWCSSARIPIVYWDTSGRLRPRLGMPRGVLFDAVFSVSPRNCHETARNQPQPLFLAPAIEPLVYNPIGMAPRLPDHPVFIGSYDRTMDRRVRHETDALLHGAVEHRLKIFDSAWQDPSSSGAVTVLPESLRARTHMRLSVAKEARQIQEGGIPIVSQWFG